MRSKVKVPRRLLRYVTHRLMVMHPHTKYNWSGKTKKLWSGQASLRRSGSGRKNQTKTICLPSFRRGDIMIWKQMNIVSLTFVFSWSWPNFCFNTKLSFVIFLLEWVSDFCLILIEQFFSYIMAKTNEFLMRWWWCLFYTRPTHSVRCTMYMYIMLS